MNIRVATDDVSARISAVIAELQHLEGPMLPILHKLQEEFGYIPEVAKQIIASALNLSRAEVHGVITFYHDFRAQPAGRHVLKLCRAEACQSMGCESLADRIKAKLGIDWHETTPDGAVTLEPVYLSRALRPGAGRDAERRSLCPARRALSHRHAGGGALMSVPGNLVVFVPRDAAALAVGADKVAAAIEREAKARGQDVTIVRNGSRGMLWLEVAGRGARPSAAASPMVRSGHPTCLRSLTPVF